jgi:hypothetical protein
MPSSFANTGNNQIYFTAVNSGMTVALLTACLHLIPELLDGIRRVVGGGVADPREKLHKTLVARGVLTFHDDMGPREDKLFASINIPSV